jgi:hypothetical protein
MGSKGGREGGLCLFTNENAGEHSHRDFSGKIERFFHSRTRFLDCPGRWEKVALVKRDMLLLFHFHPEHLGLGTLAHKAAEAALCLHPPVGNVGALAAGIALPGPVRNIPPILRDSGSHAAACVI